MMDLAFILGEFSFLKDVIKINELIYRKGNAYFFSGNAYFPSIPP